MSVLTGDYRFAQSYTDILERSVSDMKIQFLDEVEDIEKGMDILKVPSDKQQFYLAHFQLDK